MSDAQKTSVVSYTIDSDDTIVDVSQSWVDFARENFAVGLSQREVVGHSLWDFIKDNSTRSLYQVLLRTVRQKKKPMSFPFRCDSPRIRRYMIMNVTPHEDGRITFTNELVETKSRNPEVYFQQKLGTHNNYYVMCSVCNKVRPYEEDAWQEVEEAFANLAHIDDPLQIVYEVCDCCSANAQTILEKYEQQEHSA